MQIDLESNTDKSNTSIRDLTKEELLMVAGGASTGDIVCGLPGPYDPTWDYWDYYDDPNYEDVYTGGGGGGGGSTSDPEPEPEPEEPADPDAETPTNPPEPDPLPGYEDPNPNPNYHLP